MDKVARSVPVKLSYSSAAKAASKKSSTSITSHLPTATNNTAKNTNTDDIKHASLQEKRNIIHTKLDSDQKVEIITKDETTYQGICINNVIIDESNLTDIVTIKSVKCLKYGSKSPVSISGTISIKVSDIVTILSHSGSIKKSNQQSTAPVDKVYHSSKISERELNLWNIPDSQTATNSSLLTLEESTSHESWDQFSVNEKLFGCKTDFDEELYTTSLDRSTPEFKRLEKDAERIAREIQHSYSGNLHVSEERKQDITDNDALDEEERYSSVIRNPSSYVPPIFRKNSSPLVDSQTSSNINDQESQDNSSKPIHLKEETNSEEKEKATFKFNAAAQEFTPRFQPQLAFYLQQPQMIPMYPNTIPYMMHQEGVVYYYPATMPSYYPPYPPQS